MIKLLRCIPVLIILSCIQLHNVKSEETLYPEVTIFTQEDDFFLHTIQKGETIYSISRTYQVPVDDIYKVNPGVKDGIKAGSKLKIPQKAGKIQQKPERKPEKSQKSPTTQEESGSFHYHVIQSGETLISLSKKYELKEKDILTANPGLSAKKFYIGKKIRIPKPENEQKREIMELLIPKNRISLSYMPAKSPMQDILLADNSNKARGEDAKKKQDEDTGKKQEEELKKKLKEETKQQNEEPKKQQAIINSANESSGNSESSIRRFDVDLYRYLNKQITEKSLSENYKTFLNIYGEQVIEIGTPDSAGFYKKFNAYFSEPTLMSLYKAQQNRFSDIDFVNNELFPALEILLKEFPGLIRPTVYAHVSGLNQNIVVTNDVLSLSFDKYMGANYPLYQKYFYSYQLQNMTPERIVPDYLLGFMMANFPYEGNPGTLLERMLYEGKLRYILSRLLPNREPWEYVAYTKEQYTWCNKNDSRIWKAILKNNDLYSSDYMTTVQYLNDAPYTTSISTESPGKIGVWIGFQIIDAYMKKYPKTSLSVLMNFIDAQQLLKDSKYKP